jgi:hypothetical protein
VRARKRPDDERSTHDISRLRNLSSAGGQAGRRKNRAGRRAEGGIAASNEIGHALRDLFIVPMGAGWKPGQLHADLSWTHYRTLIKVGQRHVRDSYEIESVKNSWSARQLGDALAETG